MENVLKKIVDKKKDQIKIYKKENPFSVINENIKSEKNFFDFKKKLKKRSSNKEISIISEIKKASPSAGTFMKNFDPIKIAKIYEENGSSCLSVLTEENFFLGKLEHIRNIKKNCRIPILCKDFFIDTYQVALAKSFGADCILIILSAIDKLLAKDLYDAANDLNISSIIEVHTEQEAENALIFEQSIIGINNRNLKTLNVSLNQSINLSKILSSHKNPLICESGINSSKDIKLIVESAKIYSFLIGESLLKSSDIASKLKEFTEINV